MLQQTTVAAVAGRYEAFLRRFPDLPSLARAREDSVLAAWSGLGYYTRARNLHRAARQILSRHGGRIPDDLPALRALPGFGDYTARALLALAFGRPALPLDANVRRIASRLFATEKPEARRLEGLISPRRPGDSVAALFDLGQLVCRPRNPLCGRCPLRKECLAFAAGSVDDYPAPRPRPARRALYLAALVLERGGRFLVRRRSSTWLSGMWEFPCAEAASPQAARRGLATLYGPLPNRPQGRVDHVVAHRTIRVEVYRRTSLGSAGRASREGIWLSRSRLDRSAVPTLTRKILRAAESKGGTKA